jgi:hypothetical protein
MNKEQQLLIDEAYGKYADSHWTPPSNPKGKLLSDQLFSVVPMEHSKEGFINKCKTDQVFSEKWGLTIEERELSLLERREIARIKLNRKEWTDVLFLAFRQSHSRTLVTISTLHAHYKETYDKYNIPTRIITLSYNNKTATSYE